MGGLHPVKRAVYVGTFAHSIALDKVEWMEDTAIGVDEAGVITFIEKNIVDDADLERRIRGQGWEAYDVVRAPRNIVGFWFPGFVDAHIHAPQFPNAGIFGKTTLLEWLERYTFPMEASFASLARARSVYPRCVAATLAHGTTTAAYFATVHVAATNTLADACWAAGQRAFIGRCNMDTTLSPEWYRDADAAAALAATDATIAHIARLDPAGALLSAILTPRFALSCTPPLLTGLGDRARAAGLPVQTHISENRAEVHATLAQFPGHDSYAAVYAAHGLLTPRTVLAHAVHLSAAEVALVAGSGATIAHCPASNTCLGSGLCPVRELLDAAIPVGLGTDVSGGYSPSILAACREAGAVSRLRAAVHPAHQGVDPYATAADSGSGAERGAERQTDEAAAEERARRGAAHDAATQGAARLKLTIEETLHLATRGGARCLGLTHRVGGFEVGHEWDAQFVDLGPAIDDGVQGHPADAAALAAADTAALAELDKQGSADLAAWPVVQGGRGNVNVYAWMDWPERLAKWVFCGDERNTRAVWVRGRLVSGSMDPAE